MHNREKNTSSLIVDERVEEMHTSAYLSEKNYEILPILSLHLTASRVCVKKAHSKTKK